MSGTAVSLCWYSWKHRQDRSEGTRLSRDQETRSYRSRAPERPWRAAVT